MTWFSRRRETMQKIDWARLRPERILALLTGAMGLVNLVSAVTPALKERLVLLEEIIPLQVRAGTRLATALAGFALILLAAGIWRGKRTAWLVTLATLAASSIGHLVKGFDFEEAGLAAILLAGLLLFRKRFQARSDAPTIERGLRTLGIALAFTLVYGTVGFYVLDRHFSVHFNLWQAVLQTLRMFTEYANPGQIATTRFARYFIDSIYLIGAVTSGYALLALLTPVLLRRQSGHSEHDRAAEIIRQHGRTVLARFCLFEDKHYFFSPGGSVIAFAYSNRTAVVLGDPIGPCADALAAVQAFQTFCAGNDWQVAFYQTLPDYLEEYQAAGLKVLKIGEEAVVNLQTFTLKGGEMKAVRTSVNKLERLGYVCQVSQPPHDAALLDRLQQISDEWLAGRKEMKYSLGWFERDYLDTTPILYIQDAEGQVVAFANLVDEYQNREAAVDLMRHQRDLPAGTMDTMFANLLLTAQQMGYQTFNLGLSGLAGVGETSSDPAIERAMHYIYTRVNTAYNFRGLHSFKEKFAPDWSPRYLIYPNLASLPVVALALSDLGS
jgi:phosphatidylglycerol lysyltransferase